MPGIKDLQARQLRDGTAVITLNGRIGLISHHINIPANMWNRCVVQFGAGGPFETYTSIKLRPANLKEVEELLPEGVDCLVHEIGKRSELAYKIRDIK